MIRLNVFVRVNETNREKTDKKRHKIARRPFQKRQIAL